MLAPCKRGGVTCPHRRPDCKMPGNCDEWDKFAAYKEAERESRRKESIVADAIGQSIFRHRRSNSKAIKKALSQR